MTKVFFSKKHLIISASIFVVLAATVTLFWLFMISTKRMEGIELAQELEGVKSEVRQISDALTYLRNEPDLLTSEGVEGIPIIPNGIAIATYFDEVSSIEQDLSVSVLQSTFQEEMLYPTQEHQTNGATEVSMATQLRMMRVGFDLIGSSDHDMLDFVDRMENLNRFLKIESIDYRRSTNTAGLDSFSGSIVIKLYYLSNYETGKMIPE